MVLRNRVEIPDRLLAILGRHDPVVRALALDLRDLVVQELAPCHEYVFQMRSKIVCLYGPTSKALEDNVCNVAVLRHHVTLTFRFGIELDDPLGLLRGSGKVMRHLRIEQPRDFERLEVGTFLRQARRNAEAEGPRFERGRDPMVTTRFKAPTPR